MNKKININKKIRDNSRGPVFRIDSGGAIVYANTAARKALGHSREKILELSIYDFDSYFTKKNWPKLFKKFLAEKLKNYQSRHKRKNGSSFPVECSVNIIDSGNDKLISLTARDISITFSAKRNWIF